MGALQAQGTWWFAGPQVVTAQGVYWLVAMPYNQMPFALSFQIVSVMPGTFAAVSGTGDQIVFQKTG